MARLTDKQREDIKNALLLGDSQYKVAQDFEVSSATVNKIFKELDEETIIKTKGLVKEQIAIKTVLSEQSESFSESFNDKVNEEIRRKGLVFNATEKLLKKASQMIEKNSVIDKINVGDGVQNFEPRELNTSDFKNLIDTIDKASITLGINPRHANTNIKVDNNNLQQTNLTIEDISLAIANGLPD